MTRDEKIDKIYDIVIRLEPMVEEHHNTLYDEEHGLSKKVTLLEERQENCPARNAETTENKKASKRLAVAVVTVVIVGVASIASLTVSIISLLRG